VTKKELEDRVSELETELIFERKKISRMSDTIISVTEHMKELSKKNIKSSLSTNNAEPEKKRNCKHGFFVKEGNETDTSNMLFIEVLGDLDMLKDSEQKCKTLFTFKPEDLQNWFAQISKIMKEKQAKCKT
jgi:uncharacterized coiled-coil protein SlyX